MATETEQLVVSLEARIRDFERNFQKASRTAGGEFGRIEARAKQSGSRIEQSLASASSRVAGVFKSFGGGFAGGIAAGGLAGIVTALGGIAKSVASIGDEAKRAGLSLKSFQELKYVAEQNRIGVDSLVDGIKELNLRADEFIATGGGPAADAFARLKLDAVNLKEKLKDPSALFTEIIGKLGQLDKAAQIRVADGVFGGNGGEKFVQLIAQGEAGIRKTIAAANDLGIVLDEAVIKRADEIDRKFDAIATTVGTNLKGAIVEAASALSDFLDGFNEIQNQQDANLNGQIATIGKRRLDIENEILKLRGGEKPNDGWFGTRFGATDTGTAIQELERENEALAENERRILEVVKARQQLRTTQLEAITIGSGESQGGRVRAYDSVTLPGSVDATPQGRVDPYFDSGSAGGGAAKIGDSIATAFIKKAESFIPKAKWDVNAYRAGFGSDTTTRADGLVERITASSVVTLADANRDLARRIGEFVGGIKGQIGGDTFASFSEDQQAALTSIAYNYGSLPDRIVKAIEGGNPEQIGAAIRDLGDDNGGINQNRRANEADMFLSGSGSGDTPAIVQANAQKVAIDNLQQSYAQLGQIGVSALDGLSNALADGKLEGAELLQILLNVVKQLISMPNLGALFGGAPAPATAGGGAGGVAGIVGLISKFFGFANGGEIDAIRHMPRYANGGRISGPGGPRSDSIPILASDGEFVVNAAASAKYGAILHAINNGTIGRFADGGVVGQGGILPAPIGGQAITINAPVTVNTNGGGTPEANADLARQMSKQLESTMRGVVCDEIRKSFRPGNIGNSRAR